MLKILTSILIVYCLVAVTLYVFQRQLLYVPDRSRPVPSQWLVPSMKEVVLHTKDGLSLTAWYQPAQSQKPTIVYFQGNGGHIGHRGFIARSYLDAGYGVLLVGYRGYGGNSGRPTEQGLYQDAQAAATFLQQQGVASSCMVLYGESLGAAIAIQLATTLKVGALLLQAPFNRLADVAFHHYPFVPTRWFLKDKYESDTKIATLKTPVLILQGSADRVVPPKFSQALFAAANEPKQYKVFDHSGHNDLNVSELFTAVELFLAAHEFSKC